MEFLALLALTTLEMEQFAGLIAAASGVLSLLIPGWRKFLRDMVANIFNTFKADELAWRKELREKLDESAKDRKEFHEQFKKDSERWNRASEDVQLIKSAIYNEGNGIEARVIKTEIAAAEQFLDLPYPAFQSNSSGEFTIVSDAFLDVVNADSTNDLLSRKWRDRLVPSPENDDFFTHFLEASERGDDFISQCSFHDPLSGKYRGKYRLFMKSYPVGGDRKKNLFRGRLVMALDKTAADIANEYHWKMRKAPVLED